MYTKCNIPSSAARESRKLSHISREPENYFPLVYIGISYLNKSENGFRANSV